MKHSSHPSRFQSKKLSIGQCQIFTTNEPNGKSALENPTPVWYIPECVIHTENIACKNWLNNGKYDIAIIQFSLNSEFTSHYSDFFSPEFGGKNKGTLFKLISLYVTKQQKWLWKLFETNKNAQTAANRMHRFLWFPWQLAWEPLDTIKDMQI